MLPKSNRLVADKEIKLVYFSKFRHKSKYWTIITRKNKLQPKFKFLVVISKKIAKRANLRNQIRRRILAIIKDFNIPSYCSIILQIHNPAIIKLKFEELQDQLQQTLVPILK
jgi:ribonuclease P protein component